MTTVTEGIRDTVKNWWVSLIVGIIAIILGVWCMFVPVATIAALTIVFIVAFFISGIAEIAFAVQNRKTMHGWGWTLTGGIVDLLMGCMLLALPAPAVTAVLIYFVGFWIMFRSIWAIGAASDLQKYGVRGWGWMLAIAILALLFSIIFIFSTPLFGGAFIVTFFCVALLVYGIFRIYMGVLLKSVKNEIDKK